MILRICKQIDVTNEKQFFLTIRHSMKSNTVDEVLKIYNLLSGSTINGNKYEETLFFKSVTADKDALIAILNGETPKTVMKIEMKQPDQMNPKQSTPGVGKTSQPTPVPIDLSKKFGFFEGNKKVCELFGHAIRRWLDSNGSEKYFNEEDMFIHNGETITSDECKSIITSLNAKYDTTYKPDLLHQEISGSEIYLHIYAKQFGTFADIVKEAQELPKIKDQLDKSKKYGDNAVSQYNELCKKVKAMNTEIDRANNEYASKVQSKQDKLNECDTTFERLKNDAQKVYEDACADALKIRDDKIEKAKKQRDDAKEKIKNNNSDETRQINEARRALNKIGASFQSYKLIEPMNDKK